MVVSARCVLFVGFFVGSVLPARPAPAGDGSQVQNVIVLIADGCSSEQYTLARWFQGEPLALDEILTGGVQTYISDSVIADSAPASTAFATGVRTSDNFIGIGPKPGTLRPDLEPSEDLRYRPLATVLEGARLRGKATGVVVTSRVSHATPAAYMAHIPSRKLEEDIMEQVVYQNVDVVLGGGQDYLLPLSEQGRRSDGENLVAVLQARGYSFVENRSGLEAVKSGRVFGAFARGPLAAEIDRPQTCPQEPTLEEMTRKAIELLSSDPDGFFLLVEGSQIDWACHANDPAHLLSDLLMFDKAVRVVLEFAKGHGNTLVLAFSDHNTGGMSIGNRSTDESYSQTGIEELIGPLKKMKVSAPEMWRRLWRSPRSGGCQARTNSAAGCAAGSRSVLGRAAFPCRSSAVAGTGRPGPREPARCVWRIDLSPVDTSGIHQPRSYGRRCAAVRVRSVSTCRPARRSGDREGDGERAGPGPGCAEPAAIRRRATSDRRRAGERGGGRARRPRRANLARRQNRRTARQQEPPPLRGTIDRAGRAGGLHSRHQEGLCATAGHPTYLPVSGPNEALSRASRRPIRTWRFARQRTADSMQIAQFGRRRAARLPVRWRAVLMCRICRIFPQSVPSRLPMGNLDRTILTAPSRLHPTHVDIRGGPR